MRYKPNWTSEDEGLGHAVPLAGPRRTEKNTERTGKGQRPASAERPAPGGQPLVCTLREHRPYQMSQHVFIPNVAFKNCD